VAARVRLNGPAGAPRLGGPAAWALVGAVLALPALLAWATRPLSDAVLSWQPALAASQPWRWWSAAWVHWSTAHLVGNLAAALLVVALGHAAQLPRAAAWAWALAWPLTHLSLALQPELAPFGGLSGVLHAGVAVAAVHLLGAPSVAASAAWRRRARWVGLALAAGLLAKVLVEAPWQGPWRKTPAWDFPVAPLAHAAGAFWGAVCGALALMTRRPARAATPIRR
jgi:rhomboid family GlyGly-CTERM serine protease